MKAVVGQRARRSLRLTTEHVATYARLTGDYNPLHFDAAFAARTKFRAHRFQAAGEQVIRRQIADRQTWQRRDVSDRPVTTPCHHG